jgi:AcrR family transcriptional regulator
MNLILKESKQNTKLPDVLRAALKLFVQKGIDGTTIKDIAKEAHVAEGALYRHYKSKDDLAWDLFKTHLVRFTEELKAQVLILPSAKERIFKFVEISFAAYESDPELYTYLILREHSELDTYSQAFEHPGDVVQKIIADGQKKGEIRSGEPFVLGSLFIGGIIRVAVVKMYGNLKKDLCAYSKEVSEGIWAMLRIHKE